jgi:hypothetical protein
MKFNKWNVEGTGLRHLHTVENIQVVVGELSEIAEHILREVECPDVYWKVHAVSIQYH